MSDSKFIMLRSLLQVSLLLMVLFVGVTPSLGAVLKLATVAPEGSFWMQEMRRGAKEIKERTEGRVQIKLFGGGVMGNEKSVLRKMRVGQLHGGAFTGGGLVEVYPDINLYSLPMVFRSSDELDFVRGQLDPVLNKGLEEAGFVSFGFGEGGFALIMAKTPVRGLDDLKGQKIWIPEGDRINYRVMESLGLSPVTLPITDVLTGLQTGLIDIIATSPLGAIAFQWHTRVKYVTDVPLVYLFGTLVIDQRAFKRMQPQDQKVVREVMEGIYVQFNSRNRKDNEEALKVLTEQGISIVEPSTEEVVQLRDRALAVVEDLGKDGAFDMDLYRRMQSLLQNYRSGSQAGTGK